MCSKCCKSSRFISIILLFFIFIFNFDAFEMVFFILKNPDRKLNFFSICFDRFMDLIAPLFLLLQGSSTSSVINKVFVIHTIMDLIFNLRLRVSRFPVFLVKFLPIRMRLSRLVSREGRSSRRGLITVKKWTGKWGTTARPGRNGVGNV